MAGLTEVARFHDVYEADLAASFLASHGVDAVVADRGLATMDPILQTALGGIRVLAPSDQARTARDLLEQARRGDFAEPPDEPPAPAPSRMFPLLTFLSALAMGHGYAGRPYVGARGRLSAVQVVGMALLALIVLWAGYRVAASLMAG